MSQTIHFYQVSYRCVALAFQLTPGGLAAGGGIGEVRTRANDDVTCSVSYETAPPLAPNRSLDAALFLYVYIFLNTLWILKVKR